MTQATIVTPAKTQDERNVEFWKDVAAVHLSPDRSHRGEPIPLARLLNREGHHSALPARQGKPMLVNFWAHWCVPCRAEMPTLNALARRRGSNLLIITVNEDRLKPTSASLGTLPIDPAVTQYSDEDGTLAREVVGQGLPTTMLYDGNGRERWRLLGAFDWTKPQARNLLKETH